MNKAGVKIDSGVQSIRHMEETFRSILSASDRVTAQIKEVFTFVEIMSGSVNHVTESMEEIARIAEESSAGVQGLHSSTEEQMQAMESISLALKSLDDLSGRIDRVSKEI